MGQANPTLMGAFKKIAGEDQPLYDKFIEYREEIQESDTLKQFTNSYKKMVKDVRPSVEKLAALEEIIIQMRIRENIFGIRIDIVKNYIYARLPFIRRGREYKDIRVLVGTTDVYGKKTSKLYYNEEFLTAAKAKLEVAMDREILETIEDFKKLYN